MFDLPPDLPRLRVLESWGLVFLDGVRQAIAAAEAAEKPATRPPLPRPDYVTQRRHSQPPLLHGPECWMRDDGPGAQAIGPGPARDALSAMVIEACEICRPDTALGLL